MERGDGAPVELEAALRYVDGDRALLADLVAGFAAEYPERLAALVAAIGRRRPAEVERLAHSLKSVLALLGAERARRLAEELEGIARERALSDAPDVLARLQAEVDRVVGWFGDWRRQGRGS
jgi:HPt (histidine-containing phosphotransfer) domain-containing protein